MSARSAPELVQPAEDREPLKQAAAPADQYDFALQSDFLAEVFRENEPALFVGRAMLRAGVEVPEKNATIARVICDSDVIVTGWSRYG